MKEVYKKDEYCMNFTNEEIIGCLVNKVQTHSNVTIKISSDSNENISLNTKEMIRFISFDGDIENFYISFYGHQTSIFISDRSSDFNRKVIYNDEFMFIDDRAKENIVSSDTHGNIVYEGWLRDKSHKEILELFYNFIVLLIDVKKISTSKTFVSQNGYQYPKYNYIVKIVNESKVKESIKFDNILFLIND